MNELQERFYSVARPALDDMRNENYDDEGRVKARYVGEVLERLAEVNPKNDDSISSCIHDAWEQGNCLYNDGEGWAGAVWFACVGMLDEYRGHESRFVPAWDEWAIWKGGK